MDLQPLYSLRGTAVREDLGTVQDGSRIKIEFRGQAAADSRVQGKAHGTSWILVGPFGPGATSAVMEVITAGKERLVLEQQGYTIAANGNGFEIRTAGVIRSSAAVFSELNGKLAVLVQHVAGDDAVTVDAYRF